MSPQQIQTIARELLDAHERAKLIGCFTARDPGFDLDAAYQVAAELMRVHGDHFRIRAEARPGIIEYIGYYNTERRHSSLGYMPPAQFERLWWAHVEKPTQAPLQ